MYYKLYIYENPINILNPDSIYGFSKYLYVWIESSYKQYEFPIHLWERLFKVNKLKNNDVIRQIFNLACLSKSELDENIFKQLYTNGLKQKYLLSSYQIYLAENNTNNYVDEVLHIAKKYFKIYVSESEFSKLLKVKDKFLENNSAIIEEFQKEEVLEHQKEEDILSNSENEISDSKKVFVSQEEKISNSENEIPDFKKEVSLSQEKKYLILKKKHHYLLKFRKKKY